MSSTGTPPVEGSVRSSTQRCEIVRSSEHHAPAVANPNTVTAPAAAVVPVADQPGFVAISARVPQINDGLWSWLAEPR
ncbi:hypothetical protein NDU88_005665 [Pleurodeles waltl]|uniref:Uncharacterized protein n=1 Tax=Pleurodeles waltl TaxID=8319 RepID=A0AAV7TBP7_PLEWA|nr:hypothetical protein NDU88_005665 [Pleurodeles waltl]